MIKKLILTSLLVAGLYANANEMETVDVKVCVDTTKNADKSFKQMKEMLISMAQDEGFNSLYKNAIGDENKNALSMHHRKDLIVKVNDMVDEGNNFCNNSTVTIKKDRLQYYLPQKVSKDRICHKDENLSPTKLKEAAAIKGYKALISEITDKEISDDLAKQLVHNYKRDDGKMYMAKGAYCFGASGEVVPFEVDMGTVSQASQALNNSNVAIKIIKNKGYAKVYSPNGASSEFNVDFNDNGFIFNKKDLKKMQSSIVNKQTIHGVITAQLIIPDDIKMNTVDVKTKGFTSGKWSYASFTTYINGQKNISPLQDISVQHSNGIRYIEFAINFTATRIKDFQNGIVDNLSKLSFSIGETKLIPSILDKSNLQKAKTKIYSPNGASSEFNVNFNGNGFIFNKKDFKKMQSSLANKQTIHGVITTQLIIPDDIKTNTVDVSIKGYANGKYSYASFGTYINGAKNKSMLQEVAVLHSNGIRYIEFTINFSATRTNDFSILARRLANISYAATDTENGEKWYALNSLLTTENQKVQLEFNKKKSTVSFNGNGFIFNKKDFKKMQSYLANKIKWDGVITTQLIIPDDIKTNTVDVNIKGYANEKYSYASFGTTINGQKNKSQLLNIAVNNSNGIRYIELAINFTATRTNDFSMVARRLANISYAATDTENGEKWYALKPAKKKMIP